LQDSGADIARILWNFQRKREESLHKRISELEATITVNCTRIDRLTKENRDTKNKLVDMQKHQMAHNLIINGIPEVKPENKTQLYHSIRTYLKTEGNFLQADRIAFDFAHRLGDESNKNRPIIAAFVCREDLHRVLQANRKQKESTLKMGVQQPREIRARSEQLNAEKEAIQEAEPNAKVVVKQDKVFKNDVLVTDLRKERGTIAPFDCNITEAALAKTPVHGDLVGPTMGSYFRGHFVPLSDKSELHAGLVALRAYKNTASATHNIWVLKINDFIRI